MNDIEDLRDLIEKTLSDLGIPDAHWSCVKATSFGQAPHTRVPHNGILAVWLTNRNAIEFRGEHGELLTTVTLSQQDIECGAAV
jgi:hypothetical protein